jgi:hypothetical protein
MRSISKPEKCEMKEKGNKRTSKSAFCTPYPLEQSVRRARSTVRMQVEEEKKRRRRERRKDKKKDEEHEIRCKREELEDVYYAHEAERKTEKEKGEDQKRPYA